MCAGMHADAILSFTLKQEVRGRRGQKKEKKVLKIDSSVVGMESVRSYRASRTSAVGFGIMQYPQDAEKKEISGKSGEKNSRESFSLGEWKNRFGVTGQRWVSWNSRRTYTEDEIRQSAIHYIFTLLFGNRRERIMQDRSLTRLDQIPQNNGGELYLEMREEEQESVSFQAKGTVKTSDGKSISFGIDVAMSQSFQRVFYGKASVENNMAAAVAMCDPLVINLNQNVADFDDMHFYFDLDCDGEEEKLSGLASGSGFLALDKNNDGCINDGNELFGAKSGDGFADLSAYDEDQNGWIDENDHIWSKLKIWCINGNGEPELYGLTEKGVGAICLANLGTDMTLRGQSGQVQGAIRKTGVFLYENGTAGTIQHLDIAKYNM